jgi:hypothetical protein
VLTGWFVHIEFVCLSTTSEDLPHYDKRVEQDWEVAEMLGQDWGVYLYNGVDVMCGCDWLLLITCCYSV